VRVTVFGQQRLVAAGIQYAFGVLAKVDVVLEPNGKNAVYLSISGMV